MIPIPAIRSCSGGGAVTVSLTADAGQVLDITSPDVAVVSTWEPLTPDRAACLEGMIGHANNNSVMAMGDGASIRILADDATKASWAALEAAVSGGQGVDTRTINTAESSWEVGDVIAITASYHYLNEAEEFSIVAIDSDTITLDRAVEFDHIGEIQTYANQSGDKTADFRTKMMLLSKDVTIQGEVSFDPVKPINDQTDTYGGHIMALDGADLHISGAELAFMGATGRFGPLSRARP